MNSSFDILGIGCVSVDDLLYVPGSYPAADTKTQVLDWDRQCGGLTGTALVAAARLGARCAFAGLLGFDDLSRIVESNFLRTEKSHAKTQSRKDLGQRISQKITKGTKMARKGKRAKGGKSDLRCLR